MLLEENIVPDQVVNRQHPEIHVWPGMTYNRWITVIKTKLKTCTNINGFFENIDVYNKTFVMLKEVLQAFSVTMILILFLCYRLSFMDVLKMAGRFTFMKIKGCLDKGFDIFWKKIKNVLPCLLLTWIRPYYWSLF